jgi:hypothetical protein
LIAAWVLFPAALLAVCLGLGLLVERLAGARLPGAVLVSVGLALLIVVATLTTYKNATANLTTPLVVALALAGYASSRARIRELRPDRFALTVGLLLFAVLAAPVVLSGNAAWLGYFQLNDSAIHFALIDQLLAHGRDLSGLKLSSYHDLLHQYISTDYPVGSQVALGAIRPLVAQDVAWVFQPYLAVLLSLGGVAIYELLDGVVSSRPLRALCAFVAGQAGLVYAFYLQASIKELATSWVLTLIVVLVFRTLSDQLSVRRLVPLAIATVAAFDVLSVAIVPWLGVPLAVFAAVALNRARSAIALLPRRRAAIVGALGVVALGILAAPVIATGKGAFNVLSSQLTKHGDLGNLAHPLSKWEMLGIWPSGDFRVSLSGYAHQIQSGALLAEGLIALAVGSALLGTAWALRRRAGAPLLLLVGSGTASIYLLARASPYAGSKVLMICSVAIVIVVMLGAAALHDFGSRLGRVGALPGWALAVVLAGGVLWTNVDAYGSAKLAPRAKYGELASIGDRFAGQGPTFYTLGDEFAVHFLRRDQLLDPVISRVIVRGGVPPRLTNQALHAPWDLDEVDESSLQGFRLLVLGRSPLISRPPADYRLAYRGRFFEVWRRASTPRVLAHLPLGAAGYPASVPSCSAVMTLASQASRERARLAYATRPDRILLGPTQVRYKGRAEPTPRIGPYGETATDLRQGVLRGGLVVRAPGRYDVWLNGSFSRQLEVHVDGRFVGQTSYEIGPPGQYLRIGSVSLAAGAHTVSIVIPSEPLAPGELSNQLLGPVVLAPPPGADPAQEVPPARARSLCGRELDWIEVLANAR